MTDKIVSTLNDLIETSRDGEQGFRKAAEDAKDAQLKTLFAQRAQDCTRAVADLQQIVVQLGGDPEQRGSIAGALHRGWVDAKAAVATRDDLAVLEEVERGEDVAKARYRSALEDSDLPQEIRAIVQRQYDGVLRNHDQVRDLRDRFKMAHH